MAASSERPATPEVSHGRGGRGNIAPDDTQYVDGEVVRAGVEGSHGDGAFSSGRGGAGNIADAGKENSIRNDREVAMPAAVRPSTDNADYHVGRGGAGNEHLAPGHHHAVRVADGVRNPTGLADKLKHKLFGLGKKSSASST